MKIIKQGWGFANVVNAESILDLIEDMGRICYQSESKEGGRDKFIKRLIDNGHHAVIEHAHISVNIITDRGVSHELVRHRLCEFSQESTRFVNYSNDKFGNEITVILPVWFYDINMGSFLLKSFSANDLEHQMHQWITGCEKSEEVYFNLLKLGQTPQQARSVLPNSLKTQIGVTANIREWRHIFNLRCSPQAHPQMRELMLSVLNGFHNTIKVVFDDLWEKWGLVK